MTKQFTVWQRESTIQRIHRNRFNFRNLLEAIFFEAGDNIYRYVNRTFFISENEANTAWYANEANTAWYTNEANTAGYTNSFMRMSIIYILA